MIRFQAFVLLSALAGLGAAALRLGSPKADGEDVSNSAMNNARQLARHLFNDDPKTLDDVFNGNKAAESEWLAGKADNVQAEEQQVRPFAAPTNAQTGQEETKLGTFINWFPDPAPGTGAAAPVKSPVTAPVTIADAPADPPVAAPPTGASPAERPVAAPVKSPVTAPVTIADAPAVPPVAAAPTGASPVQQPVAAPKAPISPPTKALGTFINWFPDPLPATDEAPVKSPAPPSLPTIKEPPANNYPGSGTLVVVGDSGQKGRCEGNCDDDDECFGDLVCYKRDGSSTSVPGCVGDGEPETNYCIDPVNNPSNFHKDTFRFKLYWQEGYYWQEKDYEFQKFCVQCLGERCSEGENLRVTECDEENTKFQFINQVRNETQIYIPDDDKCLEARPEELNWRVEECDDSNVSQRFWAGPEGNFNGERFEFRPLSVAALNVCMVQRHHPKNDEIIFQELCETAQNDRTSFWMKY